MLAFDVAVVGAGPVGCVAALAHARKGLKVALLEATPARKNRFAGELLHPPAVAALRAVGITDIPPAQDHEPNKGFAVFTAERDEPFVLDHPTDRGITFEFNAFVDTVREQALAHDNVTWLPYARVTAVEQGRLTYRKDKEDHVLEVGRIIGADGRFSIVRKSLGLDHPHTNMSNMAGLVLKGVELPFEGYGHVMLGGPGPVLAYRIGEDEIRICIDVPPEWKKRDDRNQVIWESIRDQLAPEIKQSIHDELMADNVVWAVNGVRLRTCYGEGEVFLVGDAVGHGHPMTGIGMTLGFGDAVDLADCTSMRDYEKRRRANAIAPALLATALYEIFGVKSTPTDACREAVYGMWADDPALRSRTMGFLTCEDPSLFNLLGVGIKMVTRAGIQVGRDALKSGEIRDGVGHIGWLAGMVGWLLHGAAPASVRQLLPSPPKTPFIGPREQHLQALSDKHAA